MNITHKSVYQSSGQKRSTVSQKKVTSATQKNKYTLMSLYLKGIQPKTTNRSS